MQIDISSIRIDGGTQPRAEINQDVVTEYAQSIFEDIALPPVVVFYDGADYWLADGFHRYHASRQMAKETIDADVKQGTRRDAVLYSVGANATHGLRRTNADKRRAVETLLNDAEWAMWSNREIARKCAVDEGTVRNIRPVITAELPQSDERKYFTKYGTPSTMNTVTIGRPQVLAQEIASFTDTLDNTPLRHENIPPLGSTALTQISTHSDYRASREQEYADIDDIEDDEEEQPELTERDRYQLAVDTGTLDYYHDNLRREAFHKDEEVHIPVEQIQPIARTGGVPPALQMSNSNEWYTPAKYVEAARELMGGIDVDPASNAMANTQVVKATTYYDITTNGFNKDWSGRVWMNPPYGRDEGDSNQARWTQRLVEQYKADITTEAVLLVNAVTDRQWFQPLWDYYICFTNHRIRFYSPEIEAGQPTHGSVLVYLGKQTKRFVEIFSQFGVVVKRVVVEDECTD